MFAPEKPLLVTGGVVLTTSAATLYTPDAGAGNNSTKITTMTLCNLTAASHTFTLYRVPPSGSASDATTLYPAITIAAKTTYNYPNLNINIPEGWTFRGLADANSAITWSADGIVYQ